MFNVTKKSSVINYCTIAYNDMLATTSVPSRVRNLRKIRIFLANFTDFKAEINIIKCKTEKI